MEGVWRKRQDAQGIKGGVYLEKKKRCHKEKTTHNGECNEKEREGSNRKKKGEPSDKSGGTED